MSAGRRNVWPQGSFAAAFWGGMAVAFAGTEHWIFAGVFGVLSLAATLYMIGLRIKRIA